MSAQTRLETLKTLLQQVHEKLDLAFGFYLWDGSTVPANLGEGRLGVWIGDEGVVASLIRKPNPETLSNLWVSGRLDIRNGTIFDLVANKPKVRTRALRKSLDKILALKAAAQFLFVPRGGPWPLEAVADEKRVLRTRAEELKRAKDDARIRLLMADLAGDDER